MNVTVDKVKYFWDSKPCQSDLSQEIDRKIYFEEISRKRFHGREWHVPVIAQFSTFQGKDVLEVGCGIATDGLEFARSGAHYVGVDLTPHAIEIARERFALFGITGAFVVANAEQHLPFPDCSFDHVYTFGVIHHSPDTEAIVREIYRVLRPNGTLTAMVYNRSSINYRIEIMMLRRFGRWLLYPSFMPRALSLLLGFDEWKLRGHRDALLRSRRMSAEEWLSMNTDGPHCPLAKVYDHDEAAELFGAFTGLKQEVWEFNSSHWSFLGRILPNRLERAIGRKWGWHRIVFGVKPDAA